MRRIAILVASTALMLALPAQGGATTINFDDIPGGPGQRAVAGNRYAGLGVNISSTGDLFAFDSATTNTPPVLIYGSSGFFADSTVEFDFSSDLSFVSLAIYDIAIVPEANWNLSVYDASNNLLQSITNNVDNVIYSFAVPGIRRLVFTPSSDAEGVDTLTFEATAVPEPASLLLLGTGLLGGLRTLRKRVR